MKNQPGTNAGSPVLTEQDNEWVRQRREELQKEAAVFAAQLVALEQEYARSSALLKMLGRALGFGADYLRRLRGEGLYAETLDEAIAHAQTKNAALTGLWVVKR